MRCKQDLIDAGFQSVPRTCPVHGIQRCRPAPIDPAPLGGRVPVPPQKNVYLAGKMRGLPNFNKPMFDMATRFLREKGFFVFSPVEHSESIYGPKLYDNNPTGDEAKAGVDGRVVFAADLKFICEQADIVALLPGWETSKGACAEKAVAEALGLEVIKL